MDAIAIPRVVVKVVAKDFGKPKSKIRKHCAFVEYNLRQNIRQANEDIIKIKCSQYNIEYSCTMLVNYIKDGHLGNLSVYLNNNTVFNKKSLIYIGNFLSYKNYKTSILKLLIDYNTLTSKNLQTEFIKRIKNKKHIKLFLSANIIRNDIIEYVFFNMDSVRDNVLNELIKRYYKLIPQVMTGTIKHIVRSENIYILKFLMEKQIITSNYLRNILDLSAQYKSIILIKYLAKIGVKLTNKIKKAIKSDIYVKIYKIYERKK